MKDETFVVLLPLAVLTIFAVSLSFYHFNGSNSKFMIETEDYYMEHASLSESSCGCKIKNQTESFFGHDQGLEYCYNNSSPVLGGVDMVQFFTAFKLEDGTYNESEVGHEGSYNFSSTYNNYTYHFISKTNLRLFEENPSYYVPQWGGFCSWGISTETCPEYGWSPTCMGPHGSWYLWTIQNHKIYFFWDAAARLNFLEAVDTYVAAGNARWEGWYSDSTTAPLSTNCVETKLR